MSGGATDPDFAEIYPALGRLVINSSYLESRVRFLLGFLGSSDAVWIVFEGQSVDWMIETGKAIIRESNGLYEFRLQDLDRMTAALGQAKQLNQSRNLFIHGDWSATNDDDYVVPRPAGSPPADRIYFVSRSRHRKITDTCEVAVADIDLLADRMHDLSIEINDIVEQGSQLRYAFATLYPQAFQSSASGMDVLMDALARTARKQTVSGEARGEPT
ncbi:hypothetical protein ACWEKT_36960 [Nocardia takedensis]